VVAGWAARNSDPGTTVAAIFPDGPQRYFDTIYNDDYCHAHGLLNKVPSNEPATIDDPLAHAVTAWTRCPVVVDPMQVVPR
ncbi:MAG TPA: pyridoxal-5'-phosphate-dependent protein subunit beta, partial [Mycobacterium sp.]